MIYCNFTTDGGAALQQIYNTCIVIMKNSFANIVILPFLQCHDSNFTLHCGYEIQSKYINSIKIIILK